MLSDKRLSRPVSNFKGNVPVRIDAYLNEGHG